MSNLEKPKSLTLADALHLEGRRPAQRARNLPRSGGQSLRASEDGAATKANVPEAKSGGQPGQDFRLDEQSDTHLRAPVPEEQNKIVAPLVLPDRNRAPHRWGGILSFFLCVILPTVLAGVYYFGVASPQYVVEWRYLVRDSSTAASTSSVASSVTTALLGITSAGSAPENYMVAEYIKSEQAVLDLNKRIALRTLFERPSIDALSRFDASLPMERFVRYWGNMVTSSFDQITGISVAQVRAFRPEDAYLIATTLVELTEELVNETAQRPLREAVRQAEAEVTRAENRLKEVRAALLEYRNKSAVIEPTSSVVLSNSTVATTLRQTIAQYQSELGGLLHGGLAEKSAQVQAMKRRIKAVQDQLKEIESEVTTMQVGNQPLSEVVAKYEQLDLERQFAQNFITATMQSLEQARASASAQRLFIMTFVKPVIPSSSTYPDRVIATLTVAGTALFLWTIGLLLGRSVREHLA
jgi:capsular polysaccharide transport system permease protein